MMNHLKQKIREKNPITIALKKNKALKNEFNQGGQRPVCRKL
jgi:hypothetical protein